MVHAYVTADAIHASNRNIRIKSELGVSLRCARSCIRLTTLSPGKPDYNTACHPRKTTTNILHVLNSTYQYRYVRQTQVNWKKKQRKEHNRKERKGKEKNGNKTLFLPGSHQRTQWALLVEESNLQTHKNCGRISSSYYR